MPKPKIQFNYPAHLSPEQFGQLTCVLPISVGQDYHEGEAFEESMRAIGATFGRVVIVIADSLQRWTIAIENKEDRDPESFREEANQRGIEWLKRNKQTIAILGEKLAGVVTWDDIMKHPMVIEKKKELDGLYASGRELSEKHQTGQGEFINNFYDKVEATVKSTYGKKYRRTDDFDPQSRFSRYSRFYVAEESPAFACFKQIGVFLEQGNIPCAEVAQILERKSVVIPGISSLMGDVHAYPGKLNQAMFWLLEVMNKSKKFSILAPIEIVIEELKKIVAFVPPTGKAVEVKKAAAVVPPPPLSSTSTSQTFFKAADGGNAAINQEMLGTLSAELSSFLCETSRLNGTLHRFQELFLQLVLQPAQVSKDQCAEILELRKHLKQMLSTLKSPAVPEKQDDLTNTASPPAPQQ